MALVRRPAVKHHSQHAVLFLHKEDTNGAPNNVSVHNQPLPLESTNELATVGGGVLKTSIPVWSDRGLLAALCTR